MSEHAPETLAVFREMSEAIAAAAPRDWRRAILQGFACSPNASGHRGMWYEPTVLDHPREEIDLQPMCRVYELEQAEDELAIELAVYPTGRFEVLTSESLRRTDQYDSNSWVYLLRPDDVPADPGEFPPGPTDPTQAGDPKEAIYLFGEYRRRRAAIDGYEEDLPAALQPAHRVRLEQSLGVPLPDDLRALYSIVDGDDGDGLFDGHNWNDLQSLVEASRPENRYWVFRRRWSDVLLQPVIHETAPAGAVRRAVDRPGWIPFAFNDEGDCLAVDMDPGPNGRPGQVIRIGVNYSSKDGPTYVADSVTSLLRHHVRALDRGDLYPEDLGAPLWHTVEDRTLRVEGIAASLPGMRPEIQRLTVADTYQVDLDAVRGAPSLFEVEVTNCPTADLSPLRYAPVEALTLGLNTIDLTPLANHPTLRTLTLTAVEPADLRPLRTCPRLYGLDLSNAAVRDIAVLNDLDGLRYLNLRHEQWHQLWQATSHPATLAAAGLAGNPSLQTVVAWANTVSGGAAGIRYSKGRFTPPKGTRTPVWRRVGPPLRW